MRFQRSIREAQEMKLWYLQHKGVFTKSFRMFQISVCEPMFEPRVLRIRLERLISRRLQARMLLMFRCSSQRCCKYTMDASNMNLLFSFFWACPRTSKELPKVVAIHCVVVGHTFPFLIRSTKPKEEYRVS